MATHHDEDLGGVRDDLDGPACAGQSDRRVLPVTDETCVQASRSIDLSGPEKSDVDVATLQDITEERGHTEHGFGAGDHDGVGDTFGHRRRMRAAHSGFVDQFYVRIRRVAREIDCERGEPDSGEDPALTRQLACRDGDDRFGGGGVAADNRGGHSLLP